VFHLVPGPGTALAVVANTGLNAFFTYRFLRQVANLCNQHDDEEVIWQILSNTAALITLAGGVIKSCWREGLKRAAA
jgi:hypothetical protein